LRVLIGGLGTLGANFLFTLLKSNDLNRTWDLSLVDYDNVSCNDLKYTWYANINKSKIVECIRLIYKIHNPKVNITDFCCGRLEDYLNKEHEFDLALDFRDNNDKLGILNSKYYYKSFINNQYGIVLNEEEYFKFRYNPKEYDSKPDICNSVKFCKNMIGLFDLDSNINSFIMDFESMQANDLVWKEEYGNKIIEVQRSKS